MHKAMGIWLVATVMTVWCGLGQLQAQEENKPPSDDKAKTERRTGSGPDVPGVSSEKPMHAYRVDFSISELEEGKKINVRHYALDVNSGNWNHTKIGTRVPVSTPQTALQYMDVGTSIECRLEEHGDDLDLTVRSEFSNFSSSSEQHSSQPIVRQINISGSTLATAGKPVILGAVDDPNSDRQFQLEATATRLK